MDEALVVLVESETLLFTCLDLRNNQLALLFEAGHQILIRREVAGPFIARQWGLLDRLKLSRFRLAQEPFLLLVPIRSMVLEKGESEILATANPTDWIGRPIR